MLPVVQSGIRALHANLGQPLAPYICIVAMTLLLQFRKAWGNIIAAVCMYGLCFTAMQRDPLMATSEGSSHLIPIISFVAVAIAGILTLAKWNSRLAHGIVGIFLLVCGSLSIAAWKNGDPKLDFYEISSNPRIMLPAVGLMMIAAVLMVFHKES